MQNKSIFREKNRNVEKNYYGKYIITTYLVAKYIILDICEILVITVNASLSVEMRRTVGIGCDGTSGSAVDGWLLRTRCNRTANAILWGRL